MTVWLVSDLRKRPLTTRCDVTAMADTIKLWLSVVVSTLLLLCVAADADSGATGGCSDLCNQMALHLDFDTCMVECMVSVAGASPTGNAPGRLPPGATMPGDGINAPSKRRFVRLGRNPFVRIGRPQRRAVSSFMRIGKRWPYGRTDDVDGDRLSAKRVASFVRIGRAAGGGKRTSAFVRIGKRSATDDARAGELARLIDRLSAYTADSTPGADKRGSPFVRIGRGPLTKTPQYYSEQKRPQFVRIGRR